MKLVIDRSMWLHGEGIVGGESSLLRTRDGKRCCLGFYCAALGVPDEDLADRPMPSAIVNGRRREPGTSRLYETGAHLMRPQHIERLGWLVAKADARVIVDDVQNLANLNDANVDDRNSRVLDEAQRERDIAAVFAKHDVEVEFVDGAEPAAQAAREPT
jgi:hypothetical protein